MKPLTIARKAIAKMRPLQKGLFLPPALFANAHLLLNKLRFAASLKTNTPFFARGLKLCKTLKMSKLSTVDTVKWIATIIQLLGYGMTGMNLVPWNIYMFFLGIFLWFAVGMMWQDRAIMVVHVGAFVSLLIGFLNS